MYFTNIIFKFCFIFNLFITPLIAICKTYYLAKKDPIFKANFIYIFFFITFAMFVFFFNIVFLRVNLYPVFLIFAFWYFFYQFYTFKNPIFSTHFYLGV